jgi:hypothetical protein
VARKLFKKEGNTKRLEKLKNYELSAKYGMDKSREELSQRLNQMERVKILLDKFDPPICFLDQGLRNICTRTMKECFWSKTFPEILANRIVERHAVIKRKKLFSNKIKFYLPDHHNDVIRFCQINYKNYENGSLETSDEKIEEIINEFKNKKMYNAKKNKMDELCFNFLGRSNFRSKVITKSMKLQRHPAYIKFLDGELSLEDAFFQIENYLTKIKESYEKYCESADELNKLLGMYKK